MLGLYRERYADFTVKHFHEAAELLGMSERFACGSVTAAS